MFNLLRDQLSTAQAEKGALYTQITSLTAEIRMLRDENKRYRTEDKSSNQQLQTTFSSVKAQLEAALKTIDLLNKELAKERDRNSNNNRKNYGSTSEQALLLNNRNVDERSQNRHRKRLKKGSIHVTRKSSLRTSSSMRLSCTNLLIIIHCPKAVTT